LDELFPTYPHALASCNGRRRVSPKSYTGGIIFQPLQFIEYFPQELVEE
jgi:hypothetical protein